jgi:hypothetical protein
MLHDLGSTFPAFFERPDVGNYLVRTGVPEPATIFLAGLALGSVFRWKRFHSKSDA